MATSVPIRVKKARDVPRTSSAAAYFSSAVWPLSIYAVAMGCLIVLSYSLMVISLNSADDLMMI